MKIVAAIALVVAACGGKIKGETDGPCSADLTQACASGATCTMRLYICGGPSGTECDCIDGRWTCQPAKPCDGGSD